MENEGHTEDNSSLHLGEHLTIHASDRILRDIVVHLHRGDQGIDSGDALTPDALRSLAVMARHGQRAAIRAALPRTGQSFDERGLDSLIMALLLVAPVAPVAPVAG